MCIRDSHWVNQLNTGSQTREQVRVDFLRSPEFQSRVTQIINQGCLRSVSYTHLDVYKRQLPEGAKHNQVYHGIITRFW